MLTELIAMLLVSKFLMTMLQFSHVDGGNPNQDLGVMPALRWYSSRENYLRLSAE